MEHLEVQDPGKIGRQSDDCWHVVDVFAYAKYVQIGRYVVETQIGPALVAHRAWSPVSSQTYLPSGDAWQVIGEWPFRENLERERDATVERYLRSPNEDCRIDNRSCSSGMFVTRGTIVARWSRVGKREE